ncbi:MAG TPA: ATP-binding protein [Polyangiales bacterium]|nr:ATP-binding protein [Polyangiales bacterium]
MDKQTDNKPAVLIVDDVEANLVALDALLGDMGCDIVRARGGNEALRALLRREFAVMLLDVQMPEIDGYEVARYARENPVTRDVPIIFLTAALRSEEGLLRGYGSGAVDFLLKPIDATVLRAKVRVFLDLDIGRRRLRAEIAAHQQTLQALQRANNALRHFTYAASHDLRAPMRAIRSFLESLASMTADTLEPTASDYLARSRRAAERMDSLLSALLVYAGLQKPSSQTQVDFNRVFEHVQADLAPAIASAGASVSAGELPTVLGDADRLYQLLLNLVSNALKFRAPNRAPEVRLSAELTRSEVIICVEDNGIGIESSDQSAIFDPFQRVHTQTQFEGSGLGLTICREIVEQHGGRLWVESKRDQGSRFCFAMARSTPEA